MEEQEPPVRMRRSWLRAAALLLLLLVFLLLFVAWIQRKNIASGFIDREFERRGVDASYRISKLGPWTQRLENVVIGDPAHPDLTARSIDIELSLGLRSPRVRKIIARGAHLEGRLVDGKLSLGSIDRLLPPPSGAPFRLPDVAVDLADSEMLLRTPAGNIGLAIAGKGNLAGGFDGRIAAVARRLSLASCAASDPRATLHVSIADRRPSLEGPLAAARVECGGDLRLASPRLALDVTLTEGLDAWTGKAAIATAALRSGDNRSGPVRGSISFGGDAEMTAGGLNLAAADAAVAGFAAARLGLEGDYRLDFKSGAIAFHGDARAERAAARPALLGTLRASLDSFGGLPLEPIGKALGEAAVRAGRAFGLKGRLRIETGGEAGALHVSSLTLDSRSGAHMALAGGEGLTYRWPDDRIALETNVQLSGGGFPAVRAQLQRPREGTGITGTARVAPFAAGGARLRLAPVEFRPGPWGRTEIRTTAIVDGPVGGGRVTGLAFPLAGWAGSDGFAFGETCLRARFASFTLDQLRLGATELPLCPNGRAIAWQRGESGVRGGVRARGLRLAGSLGGSALSFAPETLAFDIADSSFTADEVAIRLGSGDYMNRLDLDRLQGQFVTGGIAGTFSGGEASIANVPLIISGADAHWQLVGGEAAVDGALTVSDVAEPPRFHPLRSDDFHLALAGNRIEATGWLDDPETGRQVTRATIVHALDSGRGRALLDVPGLRFGPGFQPEQLTPLTIGVVALVDGVVHGSGEIVWSPEGTTSTGTFATSDLDLAAPFGPVKGLDTTIRFTDLLGLVTAPGQIAAMDEIQAGITVYDGSVRYAILPDLRVRVEAGRWPFAGGELLLDETVLDFGEESEKHLTFRVVGMDAAAFVQLMEFKNIYATGTFDGVVPMMFDSTGGYIVNGRLAARPPGGVVSYIGELTDKDLGTYGKLAFDALKSLRYDKLAVTLDGALDGEFIAGVELDGIARESKGPGGIAGLALRQLSRIPFEFNITARGRFRALMSMLRSFDDPTPLLQSALSRERLDLPPAADVQVEESEDMR